MNIIGKKIDRYEVLEQIGKGGMAEVYKVKDTRLNRIVALKMIRTDAIPKEQHERFLARFEREAQALANLDHPNIIPVHDYGDYYGNPYIVMKYQSGGTLKDKMGIPMDFQEAAKLLIPIANALAYAHEHGIIHRDVKPSNILLNGRPMLADFGIAKMLESDERTLTATGMGVGTPEYMAPEQWKGNPVYQTDTYALGVVFYELVTGQKPFTADTPLAIGIKQATEPLTSPIKIIASIPKDVETMLFKAMALNPNDRFAVMRQFESALNELNRLDESDVEPSIIEKEIEQKDKENNKIEEFQPSNPLEVEEQETVDYLSINEEKQNKIKEKSINQDKGEYKTKNWMILPFVLVIVFVFYLITSGSNSPKTLSNMKPTSTNTIIPTKISTPSITIAPTITPIPILEIGSTMIREKDTMEMVYVPAGEFEMGSTKLSNENPVHSVFLDSYWIDKYEVTNAQYSQFLDEMENQNEIEHGWLDLDSEYIRVYFDDENWRPKMIYENHPVIEVSWYGAQAYCEWVGGRLPTEAEWEKAARGTDGRKYPWGNTSPSSSKLNYNLNAKNTTIVGTYNDGTSPYGVKDMAGNVLEWVSDWYDINYYESGARNNPTGPKEGVFKILRGGSWHNQGNNVRTTIRYPAQPTLMNTKIGFRCVFPE